MRQFLISKQSHQLTESKERAKKQEVFDAKFRVKNVYKFLSAIELRNVTASLSKGERKAHETALHTFVKNPILNINIWNSKGVKYAQLNQVGKCLAHGRKLREFLAKANLTAKKEIYLEFSASQWDRCREHGPAEELAQFLLELPSSCDDRKVTLKIDNSGESAQQPHGKAFDMNLLMHQLAIYKPDFVFKDVSLKGNSKTQLSNFAEAIDILFTKARKI